MASDLELKELPEGYVLRQSVDGLTRFLAPDQTVGLWRTRPGLAVRDAVRHFDPEVLRHRKKAPSAQRQQDRKTREAAAGRVRRGYYATPAEHTALGEHLGMLRGKARFDTPVADADDAPPDFTA